MDSSSASPPLAGLSQPRRAGLKTAALALTLALYGLLLARFMGAYAGGSDSSGYLNNARLISQGHFKVARQAIAGFPPSSVPEMTFVPLGFRPVGEREMVPTYPMGLPLMIVAVARVTGWDLAPHVTLWLHGLMGVVLLYLFARRLGLSALSAATGALLLAASPLYLFMSLQAMSDVPALVWCMAAVYGAWRSRSHAGWAIPAGVAVALAVLVRPTNILIFAPVATCLGFSWRRWLGLAAGGAPGAVFLLLLNHHLYGSYITTGYGNMSSAFGAQNLTMTLRHYGTWFPVLFTPAVLLVLAAPWVLFRHQRPLAWVLLLWLGAFLGFYAPYFHTSETWWYLRFVLPAFPAVILALLFAGEALARAWSPRLKQITAIAMFAGILGWDAYWVNRLHALLPGQPGGEGVYPEAARWARAHLPANAIVFCTQVSGAFYYYTDFSVVRWDQRGARLLERIAPAAAANGRPIYAVIFPEEAVEALEGEIPGHWTQVGNARQISFWRFDGLEPRTTGINPGAYLGSIQDRNTELTLRTVGGWYDVERNAAHVWCWNHQPGALDLETQPVVATAARLELAVRSLTPGTLQVSQNGRTLWHGPVGLTPTPVAVNFQIVEGHARLDFSSDVTPVREKSRSSARPLTFAIYDPKLSLVEPAR